MCDLLPCPHRGKYRDISENLQSDKDSKEINKGGTTDKFKQDEKFRQGEKPDLHSDRLKNIRNENTEGDIVIDGKRSVAEELKKEESLCKYKQFLEAEKPDVESRSDSEKSVTSDRSRRGREKKKKVVKETLIASPAHSDTENKALKDKALNSKSKQEKHGVSERTTSDSEDENIQDKGPQAKDERSRSLERKTEKLRPRLSSSPKAGRGVDEAIGQVCNDHIAIL